MNIKTKKIIAREFLILIIVAAIGLIFYLGTYTYNSFRHHQVKGLKEEVIKKEMMADSLSKIHKAKIIKQEWYFKKFNEEYDLGDFNTSEKWWAHSLQLAQKDSINYKWNGIWSEDKTIIKFLNTMGFQNGDTLQKFIIKNTIDKADIENNTIVENLQKEITEIETELKIKANSVLTQDEQLLLSIKTLIIIVFLLFGMRYLYYSIKWSLKTLNQKTE